MLGSLDKREFVPEKNYREFYKGHRFEPLPEPQCYVADMVMPRVGWAVDVARETKASHVLDLCCLDGFALLTMANRLQHLVGTGVDLSEPGIKLAQARADEKRFRLRFLEQSVESFQDQVGYDLVLLFEAIEHFTDPDAVMDVIRRNLNPGGTLLVSTPDAEGHYGIRNVEDICHLQVYSHRQPDDPNFPLYDPASPIKKPVISLPHYLQQQGFQVESTDVWNQLVHVRAVLQ